MSQQINLFNPVFRKQKKQFSAITMAQALGVILLGSVLLYVYAGYQLANLGKDASATTVQLGQAQAQLDKLKGDVVLRKKSAALEDDIQKTQAEVRSLEQVFATLQKGEFGNTKGYSEYFRAFARQIVTGLWLTGFSIYGAGTEIGLQGRAMQPELVPAYINRLKNEKVMQGKSFATLEMQTPQAEQAGKVDPATLKQPAPIGYIEFNLQSSGITEPAGLAGAKVK